MFLSPSLAENADLVLLMRKPLIFNPPDHSTYLGFGMEEDSYSRVCQNYPKVVRTRGYREEQEKGCGPNSDLTALKIMIQPCLYLRDVTSTELGSL